MTLQPKLKVNSGGYCEVPGLTDGSLKFLSCRDSDATPVFIIVVESRWMPTTTLQLTASEMQEFMRGIDVYAAVADEEARTGRFIKVNVSTTSPDEFVKEFGYRLSMTRTNRGDPFDQGPRFVFEPSDGSDEISFEFPESELNSLRNWYADIVAPSPNPRRRPGM